MALAYNTIDADGHILEPLDLWDKYIDPEFRERRPRFTIDDNGKERLKVEGKLLGNPRGIGSLGSVGVRQGTVKPDTLKYAEGKKGGFDPHARIVDMDADGIDAAFLYPSLGLFAGAVEDPGLAAAMCRAYNRWLADYCKPYPDRLFGVAMLPMQSVELAIDEMRYAREKLGMRGGFLRPNPYHGNKMISDPMYEPFWTMAEELDFSIGFHEGSTTAMPTVGVDRYEADRAARHMMRVRDRSQRRFRLQRQVVQPEANRSRLKCALRAGWERAAWRKPVARQRSVDRCEEWRASLGRAVRPGLGGSLRDAGRNRRPARRPIGRTAGRGRSAPRRAIA